MSITLSDVVKIDVAKKSQYDELVKKVNATDTSKLVSKTDYNVKTKDIEDKIPDITNLATTTALTNVENKISDVSDLVKKADYDAKIKDIKDKYLTTSDYNKILDLKIKAKRLVDESGLNFKEMILVFLSTKVTFSMIKHNFT